MFLFWTLSYESVGSRLSGRTGGPLPGGNSVGWYLEQRGPKNAAQSMQFAFKKIPMSAFHLLLCNRIMAPHFAYWTRCTRKTEFFPNIRI
jgi:hypothetical protein